MGRVARYKRTKSFDPFSTHSIKNGRIYEGGGAGSRAGHGSRSGGTHDSAVIWGTTSDGRRPKKRSRTAIRLREQKKRNRKTTRGDEHDDDGAFDAPPAGEDEFDLRDPIGSLRRIATTPPNIAQSGGGGGGGTGASNGVDFAASNGVDFAASNGVDFVAPRNKPDDDNDDDARPDGPRATIPQTDKEEREMRRIAGVVGRKGVGEKGGGGHGTNGTGDEAKPAIQPRRPGESLRRFERRVDSETWQFLHQKQKAQRQQHLEACKKGGGGGGACVAGAAAVDDPELAALIGKNAVSNERDTNPERAKRKKEYMKAKRAKKKEGLKRHLELQRLMKERRGDSKGSDAGAKDTKTEEGHQQKGKIADKECDDSNHDGSSFIAKHATTVPKAAVAMRAGASAALLHDWADRPPDLKHIPRGALTINSKSAKAIVPERAMLLLGNKRGEENCNKRKRSSGNDDNNGNKRSKKRLLLDAKHTQAMEVLRKKIQEQYRAIKAKRRET